VCEHRIRSKGGLREVGCTLKRYPDRLCAKNVCSKCESLLEYDDESDMQIVNGEVSFGTGAMCTFYGKLAYENARKRIFDKRLKEASLMQRNQSHLA
jgi:hypothetical protein